MLVGLAVAAGVLGGAVLAVLLLRPGSGPLAAGPAPVPAEVTGFAELYVRTYVGGHAPGNEAVLAPFTPAGVTWTDGAIGDRHVVDTTTMLAVVTADEEWRVEVVASVMDYDRSRDGYSNPVTEHYEVIVALSEGRLNSRQLPARIPGSAGSAPGLAPVLEPAESGEVAAATKLYLDRLYAAMDDFGGYALSGIAVEPVGDGRSRVVARVEAVPRTGAVTVHDHVLLAVDGEGGWEVGPYRP